MSVVLPASQLFLCTSPADDQPSSSRTVRGRRRLVPSSIHRPACRGESYGLSVGGEPSSSSRAPQSRHSQRQRSQARFHDGRSDDVFPLDAELEQELLNVDFGGNVRGRPHLVGLCSQETDYGNLDVTVEDLEGIC